MGNKCKYTDIATYVPMEEGTETIEVVTWNDSKTGAGLRYLTNLVFHILMLAIFEPLFFFLYITNFETNSYNDNVINYINALCVNLDSIPSEYLRYVRMFLFGSDDPTAIRNQMNVMKLNAMEAHNNRVDGNNDLIYTAIIMAGVLTGAVIALITTCYLLKVKLYPAKIIGDNIFHLVMIGAYEYLFFSYILSRYNIETYDELSYNVMVDLSERTDILN